MRKQKDSLEFCMSCECELLLAKEKFGPFCGNCFKKTKRRDSLTAAAIAQALVAVVPTLCPHEGSSHGRCKFSGGAPSHFSVIVLDRHLEPTEITGPYSERAAERKAKAIRRKIERKGGRR